MPGESPAIFGDALRRLASGATYLYQDGPRYWYSTQPTVTKLAEDRAEQLKRDPDAVNEELEKRLKDDLRSTGDFRRIHPLPTSGQEVPDDLDARLVVLGPDCPYTKEAGNKAEVAAKAILESRGSAPRLFRNTLVFLAADEGRLQDLLEAVRRFLAWQSIVAERDSLNLDPLQVKQAETQRTAAEGAVKGRIPETYQWLLIPVQNKPQDPVTWQALKVSGQDALAVRASKKLRNDESLITALAGTRLRIELDKIPLWRGDHVTVKQLVEDMGRYLYLPRLSESSVLLQAIRDGLRLMTWAQESFAYADDWDEVAGRYRGLRGGKLIEVSEANLTGLLVRPEVARRQLDAEQSAADGESGAGAGGMLDTSSGAKQPDGTSGPDKRGGTTGPTRFYGTVSLDPTRVGRDAGRIAEEVIAHLAGLQGAAVKVTLEIEAQVSAGTPDNVVRTVTENSRTLKFSPGGGFEND
jgi:hypothetical protein